MVAEAHSDSRRASPTQVNSSIKALMLKRTVWSDVDVVDRVWISCKDMNNICAFTGDLSVHFNFTVICRSQISHLQQKTTVKNHSVYSVFEKHNS